MTLALAVLGAGQDTCLQPIEFAEIEPRRIVSDRSDIGQLLSILRVCDWWIAARITNLPLWRDEALLPWECEGDTGHRRDR